MLELAQVIAEYVGWNGKFLCRVAQPDGAMKKILRAERMVARLEWTPATALREGIRETVHWHIKQMHNTSAL